MDSAATYATMSDERGAVRSSATDLLRATAQQRALSASSAPASAAGSCSSSPDSSPPHSLASSTRSGSGSYTQSIGSESLLAEYSSSAADFATADESQSDQRARAASSAAAAAVPPSSHSTRRPTDDGMAAFSAASASSSSSSSSYLHQETAGGDGGGGGFLGDSAADPSAGFGGELLFDDEAAPAAAGAGRADGSSSSGVAMIDSIARAFRRCSCSARDIRVLLMLLPLTMVVLFATGQNTAGFVLLGFTVLVGAVLIARIVQIMGVRRARRQQQYGMLDPAAAAAAEEGNEMVSLGAALGFAPASSSGSGRSRGHHVGRSGARYHSSLLHPAARHNPTALRLALADRDFGPNDYDLLLRLDSEHQAQVFTGIPASQIQRLPTWRVPKATATAAAAAAAAASKENVCAVCLEEKAEGEMVRTLPCLHAFHVPCIDPWLQSHVKCPVCQFKVQFPD